MIRIGLSANQDTIQSKDCMPPDYVAAIFRAGALPLIFPLLPSEHGQYEGMVKELVDSVDAIVFTGGPDFDPVHYGQEKHDACGDIHPIRDKADLALMQAALNARKPFLGICRGMQLLNIALGGSLYQDLQAQIGPAKEHNRTDTLEAHRVSLVADTLLRRVVGQDSFLVNSRHHQAIEKLGQGLRVSAHSEDGLIEAVEFEDGYPALALQWHPENLAGTRADQQALFHWLVGMAEQRK